MSVELSFKNGFIMSIAYLKKRYDHLNQRSFQFLHCLKFQQKLLKYKCVHINTDKAKAITLFRTIHM